eukprot:COSAG02_NODE_3236_length_7125_cov_3.709081_1_plen_704_part_10
MASVDDCIADCQADTNCHAFDINFPFAGTCWFFSDADVGDHTGNGVETSRCYVVEEVSSYSVVHVEDHVGAFVVGEEVTITFVGASDCGAGEACLWDDWVGIYPVATCCELTQLQNFVGGDGTGEWAYHGSADLGTGSVTVVPQQATDYYVLLLGGADGYTELTDPENRVRITVVEAYATVSVEDHVGPIVVGEPLTVSFTGASNVGSGQATLWDDWIGIYPQATCCSLEQLQNYVGGDGTGEWAYHGSADVGAGSVTVVPQQATDYYVMLLGGPNGYLELSDPNNRLMITVCASADNCDNDAAEDICTYVVGDGVGGSEVGIGNAPDPQACAALVLQVSPTANGATYSNTGGTQCYAEFGMTDNNDSASWQTCFFQVCSYSPGDGVGGTESYVGNAGNPQACAALVKSSEPDANGATYSNTGGTQCYAEFGMTDQNSSGSWQTCFFETNVDIQGCQWSTGDGTGGTETFVGDVDNAAQCVTLVSANEPTANGATYSGTGGTQCYAEFGMTGQNGAGSWQTCLFVPGFCDYVSGDGIGGTESNIGQAANHAECVNLVQLLAPDANGATYHSASGSASCYAEFGMTGPNTSGSWSTCMFPAVHCEFVVGDGTGGTESMVGTAAGAMDCAALVLDTAPEANGATYSATGSSTNCYAEFGMTGANGSTSWQTCMFPPEGPPPLENVIGCEWWQGDGIGGSEQGVGDQ